MATVYRIETAEGVGPYGRLGQKVMCNEPIEMHGKSDAEQMAWIESHQIPGGKDGISSCWIDDQLVGERPIGDAVKWGKQGLFGCASPEQLCHWFTPSERKGLAALGFHVAVYDVPEADIHRGGHQVFYHSIHAKLLRTEALETFTEKEDA